MKKYQPNSRLQARMPAQFQNGRPISGPYSPQGQLRSDIGKAVKQTINQGNIDISGTEKAKIFDVIDPKNNGPQRSNKLGY